MCKFKQFRQRLIQKLQFFSFEHGQYPSQNLTITIDPITLLALLKGQNNPSGNKPILYPLIYWQNKEHTHTLASFGSIEVLNHIPNASDQQLYLGGLAFQQQGEQWPDFPSTCFIRPLMVFQKLDEQWEVIFHFDGNNAIDDTIKAVSSLQAPQSNSLLSLSKFSRQDTPNQQQWAELVELAIEYKALLPKVVLSRQTELCFDSNINVWDVMALWQKANINSFHYVFRFSEKRSFISCSPERLYSRHHQSVTTEALAGTAPRGMTANEDQWLKEGLFHDKKIDRENHIVQEFIVASLKQLKAQVNCSPIQVMQLQNVQHLCVPIKASLPKEVKDNHLLHSLHPTPAVGGIPKLSALQFINDNEPYIRGWYAGAVGYISKDSSDFSVAIRSALIKSNSIKLFAGAGIVTGSIASDEWQELDNKIGTILTILNS
ncbi:isochorismate synthase [Psychromonas sp. B3M02]|uniref:isochorismate synthase n=1 Tax=Psychromonas sp. B3M02 TaxID=2267226 RepID=UPI000DEB8DFE|nr:isochorismate synthase [Psychromonas sp. B3M02]RBW45587.1 isochorismate synthase [Psychromonas sp. B3M02]